MATPLHVGFRSLGTYTVKADTLFSKFVVFICNLLRALIMVEGYERGVKY